MEKSLSASVKCPSAKLYHSPLAKKEGPVGRRVRFWSHGRVDISKCLLKFPVLAIGKTTSKIDLPSVWLETNDLAVVRDSTVVVAHFIVGEPTISARCAAWSSRGSPGCSSAWVSRRIASLYSPFCIDAAAVSIASRGAAHAAPIAVVQTTPAIRQNARSFTSSSEERMVGTRYLCATRPCHRP